MSLFGVYPNLYEVKSMVRNGTNIVVCLLAHIFLGTLAHSVEQRLQFSVMEIFVYQEAMMFRTTKKKDSLSGPSDIICV